MTTAGFPHDLPEGRDEPGQDEHGQDERGREESGRDEQGRGRAVSGPAALAAPAVASWLTALVLLGCPAVAGAAVALAAAVACAVTWALARHRSQVADLNQVADPDQVADPGQAPAGERPAVAGGGWAGVAPRHRSGEQQWWTGGTAARIALAVLASVAVTAAVTAFTVHGVTTGPVPDLARRDVMVTAEAEITDDPRIRPHQGGVSRRETAIVRARMLLVSAAQERYAVDVPVVLLGPADGWRPLLPSQRVRVRGRLRPAEQGEPVAAVMLVRGQPEPIGAPSAVQRAAGVLRAGLREASDVLPDDQRGLLPGLVVGDVSRLDEEVRLDLATAGLGHLTAVSGTNLAVVAGAVLLLGRFAGLPLAIRAVVAVLAMIAFSVVARPSPSVLRALVMGTVAAVALGTGRTRDGVAALSATVLGLVVFDPGLARQWGFALSVFATGGILVLAPRWRDRLTARRVPRLLAEALAVTAAAQAAVTPLLVLMSGRLDLAAVPANLLAEPAVAPATVLGFGAAVIAPVSMDLARLLVRPAGWAVGWIIAVAQRAADLPFASAQWFGGVAGVAALAAAAVGGWLVLRGRARRRVVVALAAGALLAALVAMPVVSPWPPPGWLLVVCDVGQGDALALAAGPGRAVVVDAGPQPGPADRCLRALGVRQVPLVVLTHPHLDHVGGLPGVLRRRAVGAVVVSPSRVPEGEAGRVSTRLRTARIPEWQAVPGMRWRFGPSEITVLAPEPGAAPQGTGEGATANNASVVLLVRWFGPRTAPPDPPVAPLNRPAAPPNPGDPSAAHGAAAAPGAAAGAAAGAGASAPGPVLGAALLAGDLETEAQEALVRRGLPRVDVLKVPHHGSSRQAPAFLAATGARAALISVGAVNDYGHPAALTLRRLRWLGMRPYRTDLSGDIAVVAAHNGLAVVVRGK
ncbi:ComEC/Rec2 family competence protein [Microbispora sp. KK1-11]|uniref:ComEC/Rec2 family competence protein n=1 Tax=Microbispora sp. KK1-11 TaxID=2053005 RepID=UPI0021AF5FE4|nr:ComEC/Rec2 family competence protein [Microbispora sp. KK1-11]